ncbi:MAG TPA: S46 family peptidase [Candidatus Solibacter sp.]
MCALALPVAADEGMWLFNQFPKAQVKEKHGVEVSDEFLEHLRLSSVRIGGGSGAFVSPNGLILTNYDVASECISRLSNAEHDYVRNGFYAAGGVGEIRCPGMEANLRYTDLRLVFAPEFGIAYFGGDQDKFTYPRYDFDIAFLRAYENGKPASTPQYLKWSAEGAKDTELVFVAGNPSTTSRLATGSQLAFYRDCQLPLQLGRLQSRITLLREFGAKSDANRLAAQRTLSGFSNRYKSSAGKLIGLKDQRLMARKLGFERRLRKSVENDPKLGEEAAKVWDQVALAYKNWAPMERAYELLEQPAAQGSALFRIARNIVRHQKETIESPAAIDEGVEIALLGLYLEELKSLGEKDVPLKTILQVRTPQEAAEAIVRGSRLKDNNPMIQLAEALEAPARKIRKKCEESIESLKASSLDKIAQYRFKAMGAADYPDATSTPRVAFGVVKAYRDKTEAPAPWATTFGGLYHRAGKEEPYILPQRWVDAKPLLDPITPFNFVSTADITDGPTVNAKGEITGIVVDGNIESLSRTYLYSEEQARAVHVAAQGIVEALKTVYHATDLLKELDRPVLQ